MASYQTAQKGTMNTHFSSQHRRSNLYWRVLSSVWFYHAIFGLYQAAADGSLSSLHTFYGSFNFAAIKTFPEHLAAWILIKQSEQHWLELTVLRPWHDQPCLNLVPHSPLFIGYKGCWSALSSTLWQKQHDMKQWTLFMETANIRLDTQHNSYWD